eukprot:CAMPEP_0204347482 /NCGR_PEP_ID=MMETSP0469-20131031/27985_1 /ASSEMBLY_ACC=CAM_ASM_000384 /TAXON_ID=2969 /ORGANISM="Oxyrrhis marina" /LENGTH=193 /DNA_ID=CAMNT_0051333297 /DNA_START=121 /DNA_END=703 /DNA_ORIENTATION=-
MFWPFQRGLGEDSANPVGVSRSMVETEFHQGPTRGSPKGPTQGPIQGPRPPIVSTTVSRIVPVTFPSHVPVKLVLKFPIELPVCCSAVERVPQAVNPPTLNSAYRVPTYSCAQLQTPVVLLGLAQHNSRGNTDSVIVRGRKFVHACSTLQSQASGLVISKRSGSPKGRRGHRRRVGCSAAEPCSDIVLGVTRP